jgi:hypothetical protein
MLLAACGPESIKKKIVTTSGATANPNAPAKWDKSSFPLSIKVSSDFSAAEDTQIRNMAGVWETTGNNDLDFFNLNDNTDTTANLNYGDLNSFYDSEMGIYKSTNWFSNVSSYALAITQFWGYRRNVGSTNEYIQLTHADIIMNNYNFDFALDNFGGANMFKYDLASVILHELGHFLGLYHDTVSANTVMQPNIGTGTEKRSTYTADESALGTKYGVAGYTEAISSVQALSGSFSVDRPVSEDEGEFVTGRMELRADKNCYHIINGKVVHNHPVTNQQVKDFINNLKRKN